MANSPELRKAQLRRAARGQPILCSNPYGKANIYQMPDGTWAVAYAGEIHDYLSSREAAWRVVDRIIDYLVRKESNRRKEA